MFPQQQQQNGFGRPGMGDSFNVLYFVARAFTLCYTPILRRDMGRNAVGLPGLAAGLLILFWGGYSHTIALWWYFLAWLVALVGQRIRTFQNTLRGHVPHSYYAGYSWLAFKLFPRLKSEANARAVEAFLLLGIGGLVAMADKPFGFFLMAGFPALLFVEGVAVEFTRSQLQAMRDAEIAQRELADRYREGRF